MTDSAAPTHLLNDNTSIPAIGLGTFGLRGSAGADAVAAAIGLGYRLIDTAYSYGNEDAVGEGIRRSGIDPGELVVTSKVPNGHHSRDRALRAFDESMQRLGLERLDLLLIHWPEPQDGKYVEAWQTLVELKEQGRVRSIGVSNFDAGQLDDVISATGVTPAVNQVPVDLLHHNTAARETDGLRGILTESYSPLQYADRIAENDVVKDIAGAHRVSPRQLIVRWHIDSGLVPIPRSSSTEHQRENFDVFGFTLTAEEVARLDAIA